MAVSRRHPRGLRRYRFLCGSLGIAFVLAGIAFFAAFFGYHGGSDPAVPTGPVGFYFVAFTGCALIGWGGGLLGAARDPSSGRTVGTATAVALVLSALYRILAWFLGDYHAWLGDGSRAEAGVFLVLALAFVWWRPPARTAAAPMTPATQQDR